MMAYQNGFVVSIIRNGSPVRETRGEDGMRTCSIPFGSEYKIRIKNSGPEQAKVSVSIDGTPVVSGDRVVMLRSFGVLNLERFVDSLTEGRKFKFVELDHPDVQDPTSGENGIIRIEIQKVSLVPKPNAYTIVNIPDFNMERDVSVNYCRGVGMTSDYRGAGGASAAYSVSNMNCTATLSSAGATVEGGASSQSFGVDTNEYVDYGEPIVIEMKLQGVRKNSSPWRVTKDGVVFYNDTRLEGIKSVMRNTSGEVSIYLDGIGR